MSGPITYNLSYDIQDGLGYFKDFTEIYWDMIGTEWTVPIERTSASIVLPAGLKPLTVKVYCGSYRLKEECTTFEDKEFGGVDFSGNMGYLFNAHVAYADKTEADIEIYTIKENGKIVISSVMSAQ